MIDIWQTSEDVTINFLHISRDFSESPKNDTCIRYEVSKSQKREKM